MDNLSQAELLTALTALAMVSLAMLRGWSLWLALKHRELDIASKADLAQPSVSSRIEIADLKERLRKLEAIAAGVDL